MTVFAIWFAIQSAPSPKAIAEAAKPENPRRAAWLLALKRQPEPTAAALRGASSSLLAFAAVACAIVVGDVLFRAGVVDDDAVTVVEHLSGCGQAEPGG